ncbi:MAG: hypothetical protein M3Q65_01625 [Chloroflexota bacterium]|nr:hypothetical protein [Chloroflexota bacterium]
MQRGETEPEGLIYLLGEGNTLVPLAGQAYDSEDLLQGLLATHPSLLAGEQIDGANPRRWLLVAREAGLPGEEGGGGRWSVDHLFLDQDAIPTIVEVKRSSDTRLRREVIGQMLDYAANAVVYWPVEALRAQFEAQCGAAGSDPAEEVRTLLGDPEADADVFWRQAKTNLQAGRMRLVFLADVIPPELRRIVEFLNGQMDPAEVLALEVKQYVGQGMTALVPRLVGQTARRLERTGTAPAAKRQWDEPSFFAALEERRGMEDVRVARRLLDWATHSGLHLWWGKGKLDGSFFPMLKHAGETHWTFAVWTYGTVELQFGQMATKPPYDDLEKRRDLATRLQHVPGVTIPEGRLQARPTFRLAALQDEAALRHFLAVFDEVLREIRAQ